MFNEKKTNLFPEKKETVKNAFVSEAMKETNTTTSFNGAMKYSTSGNDFVDQFASISRYKKPRSYDEIAQDMNLLWSQDPLKTLQLTLYIRMITRKPDIIDGDKKITTEETQKGQGMKHEGIFRFMWIAINHPNVFKKNIDLIIAVGSWKDIFVMLSTDLQYNGWEGRVLDWDFLGSVILSGLENKQTTNLVRKYMPTIRSAKNRTTIVFQANTMVGKWLSKKLYPGYPSNTREKYYRQVKSNGNAHTWQQNISKQLYDKINFNTIAGIALAKLVGGEFLKKHGLTEKYSEWIKAHTKEGVKYNGFVFDIFNGLTLDTEQYKKDTINAQFTTLTKEKHSSKLLVARDISASMQSKAIGCNMTSFDIAKALALYFSESLTGIFANTYVEFADNCQMREWKGQTAVDRWINDKSSDFGSTNFQSVIDLLIALYQKGIKIEDFPEGILCVSDGDFNWSGANKTNFQQARRRMLNANFPQEFVDNFKIILWDVPNSYYWGGHAAQFEDFANCPNSFHMSGYDPSAISFLLDGADFKATPKTNEELLEAALSQEIMQMLEI